jgi:hypothetical protein
MWRELWNPIVITNRPWLRETVYDFGVWAQSWNKRDLAAICFIGGGVLYFVVRIVGAL